MRFHAGSAALGFLLAAALGFLALRVSASNMRASQRSILDAAHAARQAGVAEDRVWQMLKESTNDP